MTGKDHKKKAASSGGIGGLEKLADESGGWSSKLPLETIERIYHPGTYAKFEEDLSALLNAVRQKYSVKNGRFARPGFVAKAIVEGIADMILPEGIAITPETKEHIKQLLNQRGINYDSIKRALETRDVTKAEEFVEAHKKEYLDAARKFYTDMAGAALQQHYTDDKGNLKKHIEKRADIKFAKGDSYLLEEAAHVMQLYSSLPGIYNEHGKIIEGKTALPDTHKHGLGPKVIAGWEELNKKLEKQKAETDIVTRKRKDKDKPYQLPQEPYSGGHPSAEHHAPPPA